MASPDENRAALLTVRDRAEALARLAVSDVPTRLHDLQAVLDNASENTGLRSLAAAYLGKIATPAALDILLASSRTQTRGVLAQIVDVLGRIGDQRALAAVQGIAARAPYPLSTRAAFAATLIAHRLELTGDGLPPFGRVTYLDPSDSRLVPFFIRSADPRAVASVLRQLTSRYAIELADRPAFEIVCERRKDFLLLNRSLLRPDVVERLPQVRVMFGLICARDMETGTYSVTAVVLTAPAIRPQVEIRVFRPNGQALIGATGQVRSGLLHFRLLSVTRPVARRVVEIVGSFGPAGLSVTSARAAPSVRPKLQASEGIGPGVAAPD